MHIKHIKLAVYMSLGTITGRVTTTTFTFHVDDSINAKKFEFIQASHPTYGSVLCQIVELEQDTRGTKALCNVIGYKDNDGILRQLRTPLKPGTEVHMAPEELIKEIIRPGTKDTALIGTIEGKQDIKVYLDLSKLLTKHVAILAKTGAGKSYVSGVLIEEILEKKIPLLIIDPHGEYSMLKEKNDDKDDMRRLKELGLTPKEYSSHIQEYGDIDIIDDVKPLLLNEEMTPRELLSLLPAKLTNPQQAALYAAMKDMRTITLSQVIDSLEQMDSGSMYNVMSMIEYLKGLQLFAINYTPYTELIQPGKCSIINLKGIAPEVQEILVSKLLKDLFEMRKTNRIAPLFCVIEEAHNFVPERGMGEKKSSGIIRTIASEGRKFGFGLCAITQRPARIEKNVLSQCNTQIILKVTNPNDVKAISASVEGITAETEKEIPNLPIGTAIITGISDMPLAVKVRPRRSKHGGTTVDILNQEPDVIEDVRKYQHTELLPVIDSKYSIKEIKLMYEEKKEVQTYLIPAALIKIQSTPSYAILVDRIKGHIIADIANKEIVKISEVTKLEDVQTYERIEYKKIAFDKRLEPKIATEAIKKKLSIFADIADIQDCFVVHHYAR